MGKFRYKRSDYKKVLELIKEYKLPCKVICSKNFKTKPLVFPSYSGVILYAANNERFKKILAKYQDDYLSFECQGKHEMLGKRFHKELKRLYKEKLSPKDIAKQLKVNVHAVWKHSKALGLS